SGAGPRRWQRTRGDLWDRACFLTALDRRPRQRRTKHKRERRAAWRETPVVTVPLNWERSMKIMKSGLLFALALMAGGAATAQTTTTYTGTIKDLAMHAVASGQVTFTLSPAVDST